MPGKTRETGYQFFQAVHFRERAKLNESFNYSIVLEEWGKQNMGRGKVYLPSRASELILEKGGDGGANPVGRVAKDSSRGAGPSTFPSVREGEARKAAFANYDRAEVIKAT